MRIRTDGDYAHRMDAIEQAAQFYDQNKTASVINACEDIPRLARAVDRDHVQSLLADYRRSLAESPQHGGPLLMLILVGHTRPKRLQIVNRHDTSRNERRFSGSESLFGG